MEKIIFMVDRQVIDKIFDVIIRKNFVYKCRNYWGLSDVSTFDRSKFRRPMDIWTVRDMLGLSDDDMYMATYSNFMRDLYGENKDYPYIDYVSDVSRLQEYAQKGKLSSHQLGFLLNYAHNGAMWLNSYMYKGDLHEEELGRAKDMDKHWHNLLKEKYGTDKKEELTVEQQKDILNSAWFLMSKPDIQAYTGKEDVTWEDAIDYKLNHVKAYYKKKQNDVKEMEQIINDAPRLVTDTVLYRGGDLPEGIKVGEVGTFKAFTSTSAQEYKADFFKHTNGHEIDENSGRYKITIYAPQGTKCAKMTSEVYTEGRENFSKFERDMINPKFLWEDEFLLQKNQRYQVISINEETKEAEIMLINEGYAYND